MTMIAPNKRRIPTPAEVDSFINGGGNSAQPQTVVQPVQQPQEIIQPMQQVIQVPQPQVIQQPVIVQEIQQNVVTQPVQAEEKLKQFNFRMPVKYHKLLKRYLLDLEDGNKTMGSYIIEAIEEKMRKDGLI